MQHRRAKPLFASKHFDVLHEGMSVEEWNAAHEQASKLSERDEFRMVRMLRGMAVFCIGLIAGMLIGPPPFL